METKAKARIWVAIALLVAAALALIYHSSKDVIALYGRFSVDESDPVFADAKGRFQKIHPSYLQGAGDDLKAIGVYIEGDYCIKFYSTRSFSYSKEVPLFCYDATSKEFRRQLG